VIEEEESEEEETEEEETEEVIEEEKTEEETEEEETEETETEEEEAEEGEAEEEEEVEEEVTVEETEEETEEGTEVATEEVRTSSHGPSIRGTENLKTSAVDGTTHRVRVRGLFPATAWHGMWTEACTAAAAAAAVAAVAAAAAAVGLRPLAALTGPRALDAAAAGPLLLGTCSNPVIGPVHSHGRWQGASNGEVVQVLRLQAH
jgi:hypothetical protein